MNYEADDVSYVETIISPERNSLIGTSVRPKSSCSLLTYCVPRHGTLILRDDTSFSSSTHIYHDQSLIKNDNTSPLKREKFFTKINNVFGQVSDSVHNNRYDRLDYSHSIGSYNQLSYEKSLDMSMNTQNGTDYTQFHDTLTSTSLQGSTAKPQTRYARLRRPFMRRSSQGVHRLGLKISHHVARPYPIASTMGRSLSVLVHGIMSKNPRSVQDVNPTESNFTLREADARFSWNESTASEWQNEEQ